MCRIKELDIPLISHIKKRIGSSFLCAYLAMPEKPSGMVIMPHTHAHHLDMIDFGTLALDLGKHGIGLLVVTVLNDQILTDGVTAAIQWLRQQPDTRHLPFGYYVANSDATPILDIVTLPDNEAKAIVFLSGKFNPDCAGLLKVKIPILLIVGGRDPDMLPHSQQTLAKLGSYSTMHVIPRASRRFEEPGTKEEAAQLTALWFTRHLS